MGIILGTKTMLPDGDQTMGAERRAARQGD